MFSENSKRPKFFFFFFVMQTLRKHYILSLFKHGNVTYECFLNDLKLVVTFKICLTNVQLNLFRKKKQKTLHEEHYSWDHYNFERTLLMLLEVEMSDWTLLHKLTLTGWTGTLWRSIHKKHRKLKANHSQHILFLTKSTFINKTLSASQKWKDCFLSDDSVCILHCVLALRWSQIFSVFSRSVRVNAKKKSV